MSNLDGCKPVIKIHIPEGIKFDCTGCANCCLGWPVPVTEEDFERISTLLGGRPDLSLPMDTGSQLAYFSPLRSRQDKFAGFTRTLEKNPEGSCVFLTEDNQCRLHQLYGAEAKPAMCQLFPYTFNLTPDGVYASISFAATGSLTNSGRLLTEQEDLLLKHWELFCKLFPNLSPDWSTIQMVDGQKLDWQEFLHMDSKLLEIISTRDDKRIDDRLIECSRYLAASVKGVDLESMPSLESRPRTVDNILIKNLSCFYLPVDAFKLTEFDIDARRILEQLVDAPQVVRVKRGNQEVSFGELMDLKLGRLDEESEDLLRRFVYCRVFAKLYFGPGFHGLSLLVGIHHLIFLLTLVRIAVKMQLLSREKTTVEFVEVGELIRILERRLSQVSLSARSVSVLEVLLKSPDRAARLVELSR